MNTFECPFSYHGRKNPKLIALATNQETWTYKDCNQRIETLCQTLKTKGIQPGDRIAIYPTPSLLTPLIFFALFRLQAIACPLNTYLPFKKLPSSISSFTATHLLCPDEIQPLLPPIKQKTLPFSSLLQQKKITSSCPSFLNKKSHATYLFTSGTTATPKIACHSIGNHYYSALGSNAYLPIEPHHRWLLSLPLYHVGGIALLFRTFLAGATVALTNNKPHKAQTLLQMSITHTSFIPTQLYRLLSAASHQELLQLHHQLKALLIGGAPLSYSLYHASYKQGLPILPSYGMTEMSSQICTQFTNTCSLSLGHPLPYREIYLSQNQEIHVRGKTLFLGYLNSQIEQSLDQDGYFATGDLGTYSAKKGLILNGRKDRLFISGGENIQPEEIENYLREYKGIINVRIEPKAHPEFGMQPIAFIQSTKTFQKEELQEYLTEKLPKFKIPIAFHRLEEQKNGKLKYID